MQQLEVYPRTIRLGSIYAATIGLTQNYMFGVNLCSNYTSNPELYAWGQSMQQLEV